VRTGINVCSHCSSPRLPHRICPNCGYYDGHEVVAPRDV
jgi:large subunit ribosomal protein L32